MAPATRRNEPTAAGEAWHANVHASTANTHRVAEVLP